MKIKLYILFNLFIIISCKSQEKTQNISEKDRIEDCEKVWTNRFPNDTLRVEFINKIISENKEKLTNNNLDFLTSLKLLNQSDLVINNVLFPIFRLSNSEIGVLAFPTYKLEENSLIPTSNEMLLIEKYDTVANSSIEHYGKIRFFPQVLNSVYAEKEKPTINYFTTKKTGKTKIMDLGKYVDECLEYFEYSFDTTNISISDKILFGSPFQIDLIYENNSKIDLLLKNDNFKDCIDCPNSMQLQKSFARLKGTDNLYFVYADTFPINNELDTPSRALILIKENNDIVYLWYDEIDLFGCSCL
ncbi:MAG: hypothetical protein CVT95_12815 [Bacteroidetes bacterium HGW-Bacteroidetes-12]|nr:MAG: hypothetical protein CVT95_12815 [Bacteroidetes bacterium HGW-Bacteroidetes-12]